MPGMARIHQKLVGQTVEILVEGRSEKAQTDVRPDADQQDCFL